MHTTEYIDAHRHEMQYTKIMMNMTFNFLVMSEIRPIGMQKLAEL